MVGSHAGVAALPVSDDPGRRRLAARGRAQAPCRAVPELEQRLEPEHPDLVRAFVLRDLSDLEYADIARLLDVPIGTVKARIHYARRHVRESLDGSR